MKFILNIAIDEATEIKAIQSRLSAKYQNAADNLINSLLADGKGYLAKGSGYSIIEKYVADKVSNEESKNIIENYIDDKWEQILQQAVEKALQHKAAAIAFQSMRK